MLDDETRERLNKQYRNRLLIHGCFRRLNEWVVFADKYVDFINSSLTKDNGEISDQTIEKYGLNSVGTDKISIEDIKQKFKTLLTKFTNEECNVEAIQVLRHLLLNEFINAEIIEDNKQE